MTESTRPTRGSMLSVIGWPPASVGLSLRLVVVLCDAVALIWAGFAVARIDSDAKSWGVLALLVVLAVAFEEGVHRTARLQIRLGSHLRSDMTSVWMVSGAIALDAGRAALLIVGVLGYVWFRQQRPAGEEFYRKLFSASALMLGTLAGDAVYTSLLGQTQHWPGAFNAVVPIVAAIVTCALVNRAPISAYVLARGMRGKQLLGSVHDNLIELATLCLGGLVAAAMLLEPWLAVLVLAPMVTLQRGALVRDLEAAAITDAKTGLLNAVAWEQLAQRECARAARESTSLAIMIIDIDRFKGVNDRYGHLVGDKVLAGVARTLTEALRQYDGLGRFGGEEFVVVLPDAAEHEALVIAERVRLRVNQLRVLGLVPELDPEGERGSEHLSVSIGVAIRRSEDSELSDLLHAADQALYRAKWNGRNQVQLARRGDELPEIVTV